MVTNVPLPRGNFFGPFIFKVVEVLSPKAPPQKGKAKIQQSKGSPSSQNTLKDIIKVNISAKNGYHGACEDYQVSYHFPKFV
jgi:hypothetical protein